LSLTFLIKLLYSYNGITFARFQRKNYFTLAFFPFLSPLLSIAPWGRTNELQVCLFSNNALTLSAAEDITLNIVAQSWVLFDSMKKSLAPIVTA
jgi:hypothetical protein